MSAAIIVALIALAGTVANAGLAYGLNARSERRRAQERADATWRRYRISLVHAAYELHDRVYSIMRHGLLDAYGYGGFSGLNRQDEVLLSTLFRFAQYFGWAEIMRRALRVPEPRFARDARGLASPMSQVAQTLATDRFGPGAFMVWREVQRAIGELMIWQDGEVTDTMGVTTFFNDFEKFKPWLGRIEAGLRIAPGEWAEGDRDRLLALINALAGVIEAPSKFVPEFPAPGRTP